MLELLHDLCDDATTNYGKGDDVNREKIEKFKKWLESQGVEIRPLTNEWEVLRFRCSGGTGVIYTNSKGGYTFNNHVSAHAYECYEQSKKWVNAPESTKRKGSGNKKRMNRILKRDGDSCFYCGKPMGEDKTEEHLLSLTHGGSYRMANMVLAHSSCNAQAGHMAIIDKVKLREKMRSA